MRTKDNSAAVAAQFGTSLKALRLYERMGMLCPPRTKAGWRVYGPRDFELLHAILSLKQLGLPLARIAELLRSGKADLEILLAVQEETLLRTRAETDHALRLIAIARARLAGKENLSAEDFAQLVRRISATVLRWTPELDELAQRFYTPKQMALIRDRGHGVEDAAALSEGWEKVLTGVDAIERDGDPGSDAALALGREMVALFRRSAKGDKALWNNSARFWREAVRDPAVSDQMRMNAARYEFVGHILAELQRRGELEF
jgi:DNA-binding transcriptional MerR regulator